MQNATTCWQSLTCASVAYFGTSICGRFDRFEMLHDVASKNKLPRTKELRKPFKAESKAQMLLREMIGFDQWCVYRKTMRILVKPGKHFWIIGNVFGHYNRFRPLIGKPDVLRIDNQDKLFVTDFCAIQKHQEETPYTDKVVLFTLNLINDEKKFFKTINRIKEFKLNSMKECALWELKNKVTI